MVDNDFKIKEIDEIIKDKKELINQTNSELNELQALRIELTFGFKEGCVVSIKDKEEYGVYVSRDFCDHITLNLINKNGSLSKKFCFFNLLGLIKVDDSYDDFLKHKFNKKYKVNNE